MARVIDGRYALQEEPIAAGGMADVYKAADLRSPDMATVAVKLLRLDEDREGLIALFFEREVRALYELRHPNIVTLLDAGHDQSDGRRYLVLEWMPQDLPARLAAIRPEGWDDFADAIALPLLEGLAHAHDRQVVHRDVKPANVLVAADGTPKLADFGISKMKSTLARSSGTVAEFVSRPYAPPEDASTSGFTRDVFGFGVLVLACLSGAVPKDYPDIPASLDELDAPRDVADLIESCVSLDPANRPANALVLLAQLEAIQLRRRRKWLETPTIHLSLTKHARERFAEGASLPSSSESDIAVAIEEDLAAGVCIERMLDRKVEPPRLSESEFWLFGESWRYHAAIDRDLPALALLGAKPFDPGRMDAWRERALAPNFRFVVRPPLNHKTAGDALDSLLYQVEDFHDNRDQIERAREADRLFDQWARQLSAREEAEMAGDLPLPYEAVRVDGRWVVFKLVEVPDGDLVGQRRAVASEDGRFLRTSGEVESVSGNELVLYADRLDKALPPKGSLIKDAYESRIALERQRQALNAARFGSAGAERADLHQLLLDPSGAAPPRDVTVEKWFQDHLDEDKMNAVRGALGCQDFYLLEGPPGTGKTSFIAELIAQELSRNPRARILLASQTHVALDNALERLHDLRLDFRLVRLGRSDNPRIASAIEELLLDSQLPRWAVRVREKSELFLSRWAEERGISLEVARKALALGELAALVAARAGRRDAIETAKRQLERSAMVGVDASEVLTADQVEDLTEQLRSLQLADSADRAGAEDLAAELAPSVGMDQRELLRLEPDAIRGLAGKLLPPDKSAEAKSLSALVALQGEWVERVGRGSEFQAAFLQQCQVVAGTCIGLAGVRGMRELQFDLCIIDEASKATATEALVPIVRADRWVLVGDTRQLPPFQEEALQDPVLLEKHKLDETELRRTLFDRLADGLPEASRSLLGTQHRMVREIGDLISHCFYGGRVESVGGEMPIDLKLAGLATPVMWFSTSSLPMHERRERPAGVSRKSFVNTAEARVVVEFLERLSWAVEKTKWIEKHAGRRLRVLALSGYRPQVEAMRQRVDARANSLRHVDVEVSTVDAVQGREADVCVFSATRSNPEGRLGFLGFQPRVNVALSRGRFALVIVGDLSFCEAGPGPLAAVARYMSLHPEDCTIDTVER